MACDASSEATWSEHDGGPGPRGCSWEGFRHDCVDWANQPGIHGAAMRVRVHGQQGLLGETMEAHIKEHEHVLFIYTSDESSGSEDSTEALFHMPLQAPTAGSPEKAPAPAPGTPQHNLVRAAKLGALSPQIRPTKSRVIASYSKRWARGKLRLRNKPLQDAVPAAGTNERPSKAEPASGSQTVILTFV